MSDGLRERKWKNGLTQRERINEYRNIICRYKLQSTEIYVERERDIEQVRKKLRYKAIKKEEVYRYLKEHRNRLRQVDLIRLKEGNFNWRRNVTKCGEITLEETEKEIQWYAVAWVGWRRAKYLVANKIVEWERLRDKYNQRRMICMIWKTPL